MSEAPSIALAAPAASYPGSASGLRPPALGAATATPAKLRKAAEDFEAQAISSLMQPMFETLHLEKNPFGGGSAAAQWQPMLVDAFAKTAARAGGIGLAAPVYDQLLRLQAGTTP